MAWWIVSVLAALASIVSLGLYLVEAIGLWPVLSILVVAVAILAMALRSALLRSPVFCTSTTIRLLLDETGAVVPLEKTQTFIALKRHITRFEERIASNLPVDDLVAEIEGLGSSVRILEQTGGDTYFAHEFARPLRPLKRYVRHVRYTLRDCFKGKDEWYEIAVLYPGASLTVELIFPRVRVPLSVTTFRRIGAITVHEQDVSVSASGDPKQVRAQATVRWVAVGSKYRIEWSW